MIGAIIGILFTIFAGWYVLTYLDMQFEWIFTVTEPETQTFLFVVFVLLFGIGVLRR